MLRKVILLPTALALFATAVVAAPPADVAMTAGLALYRPAVSPLFSF